MEIALKCLYGPLLKVIGSVNTFSRGSRKTFHYSRFSNAHKLLVRLPSLIEERKSTLSEAPGVACYCCCTLGVHGRITCNLRTLMIRYRHGSLEGCGRCHAHIVPLLLGAIPRQSFGSLHLEPEMWHS